MCIFKIIFLIFNMRHQQKKILPPFRPVNSKPMLFLNAVFGLFWVFFALFFLGGILFLTINSREETGLDEKGTLALFFVFSLIILAIIVLILYSRKKMYTSIIIDEKGIRYLNAFNNKVRKEIRWSNFAKREKVSYILEPPKFDVSYIRQSKSFFDQFFWPVLINNKIEVHSEMFLGKHFFAMLYANRLELIRTFLLGLAHYRPDITVNPEIFSNHYIDMESYTIDYNQRRKIGIIAGLVCALIFAIIYFSVF